MHSSQGRGLPLNSVIDVKLSIIIKCYQDSRIFDCINSIDEDCEVLIPYSGDTTLASEIADSYPNAKIINAPIGNLSASCNLGISACTGNSVLIMDSDARFKAGSIRLIIKTLKDNIVVKPWIVYEHDNSVVGSEVIAKTRQRFNDMEVRALTPGLAFRKEIKELIGGQFFDERVLFTEDAFLDWKLKKAGIHIHYLPEAVVYHSPVSLFHDLRAGFRMGYGHRRAVYYAGRENDNSLKVILKRLASGTSLKQFVREGLAEGFDVSCYTSAWSILYNIGYINERFKIALRETFDIFRYQRPQE